MCNVHERSCPGGSGVLARSTWLSWGNPRKRLLEKLRGRLDQGLSWEVKRQLVEALVGGIRIDTCEEDSKRCASVTVTYRSLVQLIHARAGVHVTNAT